MSKYKVGDKVRVRSDLVAGTFVGNKYIFSDMVKFSGEVVTISESDTTYHFALIKEDFGEDMWTDEMFSGLAEGPLIDIEFEEKHRDDVLDAVSYAFRKLSGLAEEPACATEADTLDSIADILQDYMDSGRLTELDALNAINKRLAEHYIGYGAEPPELVRCIPDDSPDDADISTVPEPDYLKVGDYVRVIDQRDERYQEIGKVILSLNNDHCFVRFEDKEEIPFHNDNLEKLTANEPRPEIKSSLAEEFGELAQGMAKNKPDQIKDSIGDMYVVLTILSMQLGLNIGNCIKEAYDEINDRKGRMIDGVFVKESDIELIEADELNETARGAGGFGSTGK